MRARPSPISPSIPPAPQATPPETRGGAPAASAASTGDLRGNVVLSLSTQRARNEAIRACALSSAAAAEIGAVPLGIVPMHDREVTTLPPGAKQRFRERLQQRLADVFANPRPVPAGDRTAEPAAGAMKNIAATACSLCGGACCTRGGDHAFLGVDSLSRVREEHQGITQAALFAAYLAHLPAEHYRDSCVYHGARGCTLPRPLRSTTCNRYNCGGLTQLLRALTIDADAPIEPLRAVIGVSDNLTLRRLVLTDGTQVNDL